VKSQRLAASATVQRPVSVTSISSSRLHQVISFLLVSPITDLCEERKNNVKEEMAKTEKREKKT
jgi:hypothetical protein